MAKKKHKKNKKMPKKLENIIINKENSYIVEQHGEDTVITHVDFRPPEKYKEEDKIKDKIEIEVEEKPDKKESSQKSKKRKTSIPFSIRCYNKIEMVSEYILIGFIVIFAGALFGGMYLLPWSLWIKIPIFMLGLILSPFIGNIIIILILGLLIKSPAYINMFSLFLLASIIWCYPWEDFNVWAKIVFTILAYHASQYLAKRFGEADDRLEDFGLPVRAEADYIKKIEEECDDGEGYDQEEGYDEEEEYDEEASSFYAEIPSPIQTKVKNIVKKFNQKYFYKSLDSSYYIVNFEGRYAFIMQYENRRNLPMARLTYRGGMNDWSFAIYKYSSDRYDSKEDFFPGSEHVDGTVEGALFACFEAYPPL